jgi:hypothetical protein
MNKLMPKESLNYFLIRHAGESRHPVNNCFNWITHTIPGMRPAGHRAAVFAMLLLCLTACGTTVRKEFYLLTPTAAVTATASAQKPLFISVGPVTLPEYLDRSQIVTRRGESELHLADGQRWAEPLRENFTRVLAEDLRALSGTGRVIIYPNRETTEVDYRVTVEVARFDADAQGQVTLIAVWTIHDGGKTKVVNSRRAEYRRDAGSGYPALVAALSETIGQLSEDIFAAINADEQGK